MANSTLKRPSTLMRKAGTISASSTTNITVPNNYRGIWLSIGSGNYMGMWIISATSSGTVSVCVVKAESNVAVSSNGTNKAKIVNSASGANPDLFAIEFSGVLAIS